jgi:hypothetical protein
MKQPETSLKSSKPVSQGCTEPSGLEARYCLRIVPISMVCQMQSLGRSGGFCLDLSDFA